MARGPGRVTEGVAASGSFAENSFATGTGTPVVPLPRPAARPELTPYPPRNRTGLCGVHAGRWPVIDDFALAVSHGLILLTAWLLARRPDLDDEAPERDRRGRPPRA